MNARRVEYEVVRKSGAVSLRALARTSLPSRRISSISERAGTRVSDNGPLCQQPPILKRLEIEAESPEMTGRMKACRVSGGWRTHFHRPGPGARSLGRAGPLPVGIRFCLAGPSRSCSELVGVVRWVEVVVDVPGVSAEALRVVIRRNSVLIVGVKLPVGSGSASRFHLAERSYGRFARVVRLAGAADASRARARVESGQLRVVLPRLEDRRGHLVGQRAIERIPE